MGSVHILFKTFLPISVVSFSAKSDPDLLHLTTAAMYSTKTSTLQSFARMLNQFYETVSVLNLLVYFSAFVVPIS